MKNFTILVPPDLISYIAFNQRYSASGAIITKSNHCSVLEGILAQQLFKQRGHTITTPTSLTIVVGSRFKRFDLDAPIKLICDSLVSSGVINSMANVVTLDVQRSSVIKEIEITVAPCTEFETKALRDYTLIAVTEITTVYKLYVASNSRIRRTHKRVTPIARQWDRVIILYDKLSRVYPCNIVKGLIDDYCLDDHTINQILIAKVADLKGTELWATQNSGCDTRASISPLDSTT